MSIRRSEVKTYLGDRFVLFRLKTRPKETLLLAARLFAVPGSHLDRALNPPPAGASAMAKTLDLIGQEVVFALGTFPCASSKPIYHGYEFRA